MRNLVLILAIALRLQAYGYGGWGEEDEGRCRATGKYENLSYGFAVLIPDKLSGCPNSPVGMSDHGVVIPLLAGSSTNRNIECYAGYNALFHESASDAADATIEWVERDLAIPGSVRVLRRARTTLGTLPAVRVVIRYREKTAEIELIMDTTRAVRSIIKQYDGPSHEYDAKLTTPVCSYKHDLHILEAVLSTWQLRPSFDTEQR